MKATSILVSSILMAGTVMAERESGGEPETDFDYSRAAISTILQDEKVNHHLRAKGRIHQIASVGNKRDVFAITTDKCELHVQFIRSCEFPDGELPQCDYKANVLLNESVGDCTP